MPKRAFGETRGRWYTVNNIRRIERLIKAITLHLDAAIKRYLTIILGMEVLGWHTA